MDKLRISIDEAKGINTNDPVLQRRIVAVFEEIYEVLKRQEGRAESIEERQAYR